MAIGNKGTALITGASAGIGAQYAEQLAQRGYDIILVARNRARMNTLAARLTTETQRSFEVVEADLSTHDGITTVEKVLQTDATITLLVNNAGIGNVTSTIESNLSDLDTMINVNVTALARLSTAAAKAFVARGTGSIIQISSVVAVKPEWMSGVYAATKAFVLAYSQTLRQELTDKGVGIQVVLPGTTRTEFWEIAGRPTNSLPDGITMTAEEMVAAALVGFDQGEFVTIPSLTEASDWKAYDDARNAMAPNLSHKHPAARYAAS